MQTAALGPDYDAKFWSIEKSFEKSFEYFSNSFVKEVFKVLFKGLFKGPKFCIRIGTQCCSLQLADLLSHVNAIMQCMFNLLSVPPSRRSEGAPPARASRHEIARLDILMGYVMCVLVMRGETSSSCASRVKPFMRRKSRIACEIQDV